MDITITIPDSKLQVVADTYTPYGFSDPGGTVQERKIALTDFLALLITDRIRSDVRQETRRAAVDAAVSAEPLDPLA
jgi:hypothetical protein